MKKYIVIISIFISVVLSATIYVKKLKDELYQQRYNNQVLKQNDSTNNVHIGLKQDIIDSLNGIIKLNESIVITKQDTIYIENSSIDTVFTTFNDDSSKTYSFIDSLHYSRFKLHVNAFLKIKENNKKSWFEYQYISFPDTIVVNTIFNEKSNLLISQAFVNGKEYKSQQNMYEKFYKSIYSEFIDRKLINNKYEWYDRINFNIGLGYNYKAEILPVVTIGYGINIKEIKTLF